MTEPKDVHVTAKKVWLPIGLTTSVVVAVATGSVWINSQLLSINFSIQGVETKLETRLLAVERQIEANGGKLRAEVQTWVNLLEARNAELDIPEFP